MSASEPGKANVRLALGWWAGAALLLLADAAAKFGLPTSLGAGAYAIVVHRSWTLSMPAAFALFGALYLGMTPGFPVRLRPALGWSHLAVMAAGAALTKAPQFALLWGGLPGSDADASAAFRLWNVIATLGTVLMGASLLIFLWALVDGLRRRR